MSDEHDHAVSRQTPVVVEGPTSDSEIDGIRHKLVYVAHGNTPLDYRALALRGACEIQSSLRYPATGDDPEDLPGKVLDAAQRFLDFLEGRS